MKTISKFKIYAFISLMVFSACTEQSDDNLTSANAVSLASVTVQTNRAATTAAPEGSYYFGWTNKSNQTNYTSVIIDKNGAIGNNGNINAYWDNVVRNKGVTFSNTQNILDTDKTSEPTDILWGKLGNPSGQKVEFTLNHRMAQTCLELEIPDGWSVKEVTLTGLQKYYSFSNVDGNVKAYGETGDIELKENSTRNTTVTSSILLPPQEKGGNSELQVVVNNGAKDCTFHRKLPTAMSRYNTNGGFWEDVLLKFEAGYTLNLTARITDSTDGEIHFTYATLTDWVGKGSGTISARPAGIYTVSDWNAFAAAYNEGNNDRLRKYGSETSDSWTFTIQRTINFTGITNVTALGTDKSITYTLTAKDNKCIIKGKSAAELGVSGHANDVTFETKTDIK